MGEVPTQRVRSSEFTYTCRLRGRGHVETAVLSREECERTAAVIKGAVIKVLTKRK